MPALVFRRIIFFLFFSGSIFGQKNASYNFIVDASGKSQFKSVQAALNAIPSGNNKPYRIFIKNGFYKEVITVDASKSGISLIGESKDKTILSFDNHAGTKMPNGDTLNTWTCASFFIYGNDFHAEQITFQNNAGFTAGQAVALRIEGNRASFNNCRMIGNQDVLFLSGSGVKQYFENCYIEGSTDFIFGASTAVFNNCSIHSKKNSHVTAASTNSIIPFGFVFYNCKLTADSSINKVSLGRPWSPTASVTYISCWLGKHIVPEGWNNWKNPSNEMTARYAEYNSTGPGANKSERAKWTAQLTEKEARQLTIKKILGNWEPISTYQNPILHADYSDPDVERVGDDYYMTASSFNHVPGLPLLHSTDLVHWNLVGYALKKLVPENHFSKVQHGAGVWAPSIRYHNNEFYIYYPDPDYGIYLVKAKQINGPWTDPILVDTGKGLIDPCPLWDDNGKVYMVHALAKSRAGINSILVVKEMNSSGTKIIGESKMVYDGHELDPTIEGPKFYKRNGWYYIFAPAGGVKTGWQTVLRAKNVYGPYERKVVMDQGGSMVNGPHQGAWVHTGKGEDWFIHFQDKDAFGRILHLQPMVWKNDWPIIGIDYNENGKGQPVLHYNMPQTSVVNALTHSKSIKPNDLNWQWQANPSPNWISNKEGAMQLNAIALPGSSKNLYTIPSLYMQKFPADSFITTTEIELANATVGDKSGLIVFGTDYAELLIEKGKEGYIIQMGVCKNADKQTIESFQPIKTLLTNRVLFRCKVIREGKAIFSFSEDGKNFQNIGESFSVKPGRWVGAKIGLYCSKPFNSSSNGMAIIHSFTIEK